MKVKELIEFLKSVPQDAELIVQKDSEGNDYSPLEDADADAVYIAETTWNGNVYSMDWSAEDACMSKKEWKEIKAMPRCVVLFPVN